MLLIGFEVQEEELEVVFLQTVLLLVDLPEECHRARTRLDAVAESSKPDDEVFLQAHFQDPLDPLPRLGDRLEVVRRGDVRTERAPELRNQLCVIA